MLNLNTETFLCCDKSWEEADLVLFGAPFDSTTSYRPGTRFGCAAIRRESYGLESYSPYQDRDLEDTRVMDSGDIELPIGDTKMVLEEIEARTEEILSGGRLPFMMGGEHLVTLGAFRAVKKKYPDVAIIHFDAHADLREDYLGVSLSHACVLRRCWELTGMAGSISLESVPGTGRSFPGQRIMSGCILFPLRGWMRRWRNWEIYRYILLWIWMFWIQVYFRERGRRNRAAYLSRNCVGQ